MQERKVEARYKLICSDGDYKAGQEIILASVASSTKAAPGWDQQHFAVPTSKERGSEKKRSNIRKRCSLSHCASMFHSSDHEDKYLGQGTELHVQSQF